MKENIKQMTEVFGALVVVAEPISEEDKVVHLLASLPPSYDILSAPPLEELIIFSLS